MESASYIPNRDLKTAVAPFPEDPMERPRNIAIISKPSSKKETTERRFIINDFCNIQTNIENKSLFSQGLSN
jgi:hypothetical protein